MRHQRPGALLVNGQLSGHKFLAVICATRTITASVTTKPFANNARVAFQLNHGADMNMRFKSTCLSDMPRQAVQDEPMFGLNATPSDKVVQDFKRETERLVFKQRALSQDTLEELDFVAAE